MAPMLLDKSNDGMRSGLSLVRSTWLNTTQSATTQTTMTAMGGQMRTMRLSHVLGMDIPPSRRMVRSTVLEAR